MKVPTPGSWSPVVTGLCKAANPIKVDADSQSHSSVSRHRQDQARGQGLPGLSLASGQPRHDHDRQAGEDDADDACFGLHIRQEVTDPFPCDVGSDGVGGGPRGLSGNRCE